MNAIDAGNRLCIPALGARVETGPWQWANMPPAWLLALLVIVGFLGIRSIYAQERGRATPAGRFFLACLRTISLILIFLVLAGPYREERTTMTERSHLVVLVDSSASMSTKDSYPPEEAERLLEAAFPKSAERPRELDMSRGELVKRVLTANDGESLGAWNDRFVLHTFAFDSDWRSLGSTELKRGTDDENDEDASDALKSMREKILAMPLDGGRTRLGAVLRNVANEFARRQDQDLAGVILISDGRDTSDGEPPGQVLASLGALQEALKVTAVGVGNPASGKNLWLERVRAKEVVLIRDEVIFESALRHTGFDGAPVQVSMTIHQVADAKGNAIEPREYKLPTKALKHAQADIAALGAGDESTPVRLRAPFDRAGTFRVTLKAQLQDDADRRADSVPEDDTSVHELRVIDQRIKVLFVDHRPRRDWRFLSDYLTREPPDAMVGDDGPSKGRFQVHVLMQLADPSFRQPSSPGERPIRAFPRTRSELFQYDVIIWGDVKWTALAPSTEACREILQLVADFVDEGGGVVLQAGTDNNPIEYLNTPLAQLLPVTVRRSDIAGDEDLTKPFRLDLTAAGAAHPMFRVVEGVDGGVPTPERVAQVWRGEDPTSENWLWYWMYRARGGLRPGALDLARIRPGGRTDLKDDRGRPLVAFAAMNYGKGKVFWSSLDTVSRIRDGQGNRVYGPFWEQVIRYLATYRLLGGNKRFKIFTDKESYFVGETANITFTALDQYYEPLEDDMLGGVHIERVDKGLVVSSTALEGDRRPESLRDEGIPGSYRLLLPLRQPGTVRIFIDRSDEAGRGERAERRIQVNFRAKEDILKVPDHEQLREIMRATHGKGVDPTLLGLHELSQFVATMKTQPREKVLDRKEETQWDNLLTLLLAVLLLAIEWALRKRWQMV